VPALSGLDAVVVDLQEVGLRMDGVATWLLGVLRAAEGGGVRVVVLDRPAPLDGTTLDGAPDQVGGTGLPLRHGLTLGEIATFLRMSAGLDVQLDVVRCEGWRRDWWFDETGLPWVAPAPGLGSLEAVLLWPAVELARHAGLKVGEGPVIGAPGLDGTALARLCELGALDADLQGVAFEPTPQGVRLGLVERHAVEPSLVGLVVLEAAQRLVSLRFDGPAVDRLAGSADLRATLETRLPPREVLQWWQQGRADFEEQRESCLLY